MQAIYRPRAFVAAVLLLASSLTLNYVLVVKRYRPVFVDLSKTFDEGKPFPVVGGLAEGLRATVAPPMRGTLVFVFSSSCPWSRDTYPVIQELFAQLDGTYGFLSVTLDRDDIVLGDYLARNPMPGTVVVLDRSEVGSDAARQFGQTPQLILLDGFGRVDHVWVGVINGDRAADISGVLGVSVAGAVRPVGDGQ